MEKDVYFYIGGVLCLIILYFCVTGHRFESFTDDANLTALTHGLSTKPITHTPPLTTRNYMTPLNGNYMTAPSGVFVTTQDSRHGQKTLTRNITAQKGLTTSSDVSYPNGNNTDQLTLSANFDQQMMNYMKMQRDVGRS